MSHCFNKFTFYANQINLLTFSKISITFTNCIVYNMSSHIYDILSPGPPTVASPPSTILGFAPRNLIRAPPKHPAQGCTSKVQLELMLTTWALSFILIWYYTILKFGFYRRCIAKFSRFQWKKTKKNRESIFYIEVSFASCYMQLYHSAPSRYITCSISLFPTTYNCNLLSSDITCSCKAGS